MKTTSLFVELIVVGSGTLVFVLLIILLLYNGPLPYEKVKDISSLDKIVSLIPVVSVIYLLGIITSSIGYHVFSRFESTLRKRILGTEDDYFKVRNKIFCAVNTDELIEDFSFRRSKVRICRGWFINSMLMLVPLLIWIFGDISKVNIEVLCVLIFTILVVAIGSCISWFAATKTELKWLKFYKESLAETLTENTPPANREYTFRGTAKAK